MERTGDCLEVGWPGASADDEGCEEGVAAATSTAGAGDEGGTITSVREAGARGERDCRSVVLGRVGFSGGDLT